MNKSLTTLLLFSPFYLFSQFYPIDQINPEIKKEAYAVIRNANTEISLNAVNEFKFNEEVIISVLEKSGDGYVDAHQFYDPNTKIDFFEAEIYDASGKSIRKYKIKDFLDVSAVSGGQLYTDDRIKYLNFTPTFYPYTVRYKIGTTNKNTLFIPSWKPITYSNLGIENAAFVFKNNTPFTIRNLDKNLEEFTIRKSQNGNQINYQLTNFKPFEKEDLMKDLKSFLPQVIIASNQVNIGGIQGTFDNWKDYGKWSYQNLVKGKLDFNSTQKAFFNDLVKDAESDEEKVDILYQYMQKKVRYIGVQLGVGGLSPFPNSYVESKSYGDCKALSNYMIGMLDAVGIKAYHTILYADDLPRDIDDEMMYQQGNHMIVYVPLKEKEIWVEATSQNLPVNYLGEMSGNRKVFIFDENGGKIIKTQNYNHQNNILQSKGKITITEDGETNFELNESAKGLFYDDNLGLETLEEKNKLASLKRKYSGLAQPNFTTIQFETDKKNINYITSFSANSSNYVKKQGNSFIFNLIPINNESTTLKKVKERRFDFNIKRGYTDIMEFEIIIPNKSKSELKLDPIEITSEFGTYNLSIDKIEAKKYLLKRTYQQFGGTYDRTKFNDYVEFRRKVTANDNIKTLIEF